MIMLLEKDYRDEMVKVNYYIWSMLLWFVEFLKERLIILICSLEQVFLGVQEV